MTTPDFNLATSTGTPVSSPQKKSYRNAHDDDSSPSLSSSGLTSTSSNYTLALERPPSSFSSPSSTSKIEWQTVEEENATLENLSKLAFPEVFDLVWGSDLQLPGSGTPFTPPLPTSSSSGIDDEPETIEMNDDFSSDFGRAIAAAAAAGAGLNAGDALLGSELDRLWALEAETDPYTPTKRPRSRRRSGDHSNSMHESPMKSRKMEKGTPEQVLLSFAASSSATVLSYSGTGLGFGLGFTPIKSKSQMNNERKSKTKTKSKKNASGKKGEMSEGAKYERDRRATRRIHVDEIKRILQIKKGATAILVYRTLHKKIRPKSSKHTSNDGAIALNKQQFELVSASAKASRCSDGKRALRERMLRMESRLLLVEIGKIMRNAGVKICANPPGNTILSTAVTYLQKIQKLERL